MNTQAAVRPRKLVLCFDGTGNKFEGDDSDSNILKIFRMLDRSVDDQYHYYQPGIGTYIVSKNLSSTSVTDRFSSWYLKVKDAAFGVSFDQHVVAGYRFLMRYYNPGDDIYIFGFSRGAYIARFLAEMLDYVGLLTHGNEEMVNFAWEAFSQWQRRRDDEDGDGVVTPSSSFSFKDFWKGKSPKAKSKSSSTKHQMYHFLKAFRETFSRPIDRIRFLGLFDTVNSVPRFETAWMNRSRFPYTARTSARVVRHAVSIDEHRAKFRQDLLYQSLPPHGRTHGKRRAPRQLLHGVHERYRARRPSIAASTVNEDRSVDHGKEHHGRGDHDNDHMNMADKNSRDVHLTVLTGDQASDACSAGSLGSGGSDPVPFRPSRPPSRAGTVSIACSVQDEADQDILEVFFSGDHSDIGGGWDIPKESKCASHVPLVWMVREAMRAGLAFDLDKVAAMQCADLDDLVGLSQNQYPDLLDPVAARIRPPSIRIDDEYGLSVPVDGPATPTPGPEHTHVHARRITSFDQLMEKTNVAPIHDSLTYGGGLSPWAVAGWRLLEYIPFRRMDLQPDGSWRPIRLPLPKGEVRDIPDNVYVHYSVLRRMEHDPAYRPGNLIVGGGGRGCRVAPARYGMGEWECVAEEGSVVSEIWRKKKTETAAVEECA